MTKSLQLSIFNYPHTKNLKLRNLIADYSAQVLVRGKQFSMNDKLSMINVATLIKSKLLTVNLLKTENCKLKTGATEGSDL